MKSSPRLRVLAASLLVAALLVSVAPARQTRAQQGAHPARAGASRAKPETQQQRNKPEAQQRAKPEAQQRVKPETAQQRAEAADAAGVTLDELFAADSYAIYGEVRGAGQYFASEEFRRTLDPLKLAGAVPPEIAEMYDFVVAHAEQLAGARVAFGGMPTRPGLPMIVAAVELPSEEEARKFAPQLREFLAKSSLWGGGAAPTDKSAAAAETAEAADAGRRDGRRRGRARAPADNAAATRKAAAVKETALPFHIRQAGAVVALADSSFTFKKLRGPAAAPPLAREPGFAAARARLASETVFLYFNTTRMSAATRRQVEEMEERQREHQRMAEEEHARAEREARLGQSAATNRNTSAAEAAPPGPVGPANANAANANRNAPVVVAAPGAEDPALAARLAEAEENLAAHDEAVKKLSPEEQERQREAAARREFENQLGSLIFSVGPSTGAAWPESIGVGAAIEGDSLVIRAFLVAESDDKPPRPVPLMPILHAGPQVSSEAANVLPDDTDILVSASLDLPQMYDYVASMFKLFELAAAATGDADKGGLFDSQIAAYEKDLKFRIKEDLIRALGNEIAVALPAETFGVRRARAAKQARGGAEKAEAGATTVDIVDPSSPVVVIALNDKRAVQSLLPRALEAMGVPGLGTEQLLQKQGEAELLTFAGGGVAFIDNFLVIAFDAGAMKRVVAAYNEGRTLGRSRHYRDPADWQPRQVIGQGYVSSALLKEVFGDAFRSTDDIDDENLRAHLAKLDPEPGAVTLAATRDAAGLTHELHVPKNLLDIWTASALVSQKLAPLRSNEAQAAGRLYTIGHAQQMFKESEGRYGTFEELRRANEEMFSHIESLSSEGYEIKLSVSGDKYEVTATPTGYPKQGRRSFYLDQTGRMRGGDLGGRPATASSDPADIN